jgi:ferritin
MLKKTIQDALNNQMNFELYSSYVYLSMAAYLKSISLDGMANWMEVQAQEELTHAMKFYHYVQDRGGKVLLTAISGPETEWSSPQAVFENSLSHEQEVTERINDLVSLAIDEKDHATNAFLQWFVTEQVEEEATVQNIVDQLKLTQNHPNGIFMMDRELAKRQITATADPAQ